MEVDLTLHFGMEVGPFLLDVGFEFGGGFEDLWPVAFAGVFEELGVEGDAAGYCFFGCFAVLVAEL